MKTASIVYLVTALQNVTESDQYVLVIIYLADKLNP